MLRDPISYPGPPTTHYWNLWDEVTDSNGVTWICTKPGQAKTSSSVALFTSSLSDGNFTTVIFPLQATTVGAPAYVKGGLYFDTTLNKLRVGGASAWETVTSA
jgi:hypothetical protein